MPSLDSGLDLIANAASDAVDTRLTLVTTADDAPATGTQFAAQPYITNVVDEDGLRLASQYAYEVATRADLINAPVLLALKTGDRVLVRNDERLSGFWSIWCYAPLDQRALTDVGGFIFEDVQSYRTSDFFTIVDWYATGYGPASPPLTTYATTAARDFGEGPRPVNTFVQVLNDATSGEPAWAWYAYDGANWNLVGRQDGTIQFTDAFFDATRVVYGVDTRNASLIPYRDGSWELRQIFNALKASVLSKGQMNDLFFSMLHFIHSQQDQVDWAFKTSFLSIVGYNEALTQTPVQYVDTTQNLIDYVDEVKPYRAKVRDFKRVLTPPVDVAATHATDFDKPVYFDPKTKKYRRLDPRSSADLLFMRDHAPWQDWSENYQNAEYADSASPAWNPIRRINVSMLFDRIDPTDEPLNSGFGWDLAPWDILGLDADEGILETGGSAGARVRAYYEPTNGMVENNVDELMDGMAFGGTTVDGSGFYKVVGDASEWDIVPYDTVPEDGRFDTGQDSTVLGGTVYGSTGRAVQVVMNDTSEHYGLRDPRHAAGHPEEFVPCQGNEFITFIVHTEWTIGGPPQFVTHQSVKRQRRGTATVAYHGVASTPDAVMVFMDGRRCIPGTDYTIDLAAGTVTVTLPRPRPDVVLVRAFGSAGLSTILDQSLFSGDGATTEFRLAKPATGYVEVTVDGAILSPGAYTVTGRTVTLAVAPPEGVRVLLVSYTDASPTTTHVTREILPYHDSLHYTLVHRSQSLNPCEFGTTIVEVDGKRLRPPAMTRQLVGEVGQFCDFVVVNDPRNVTVWTGQTLYRTGITAADPLDLDPRALAPGIYTAGRTLIFNDPALVGQIVTVACFEDYEFTINDGVVILETPVTAQNRVESTTFQNGQLMGMETYVFHGESDGFYRLSLAPDADQCIVSINGRYLTPGIDFTVSPYGSPWDWGSWDTIEWDIDKKTFRNVAAVFIPGGQPDTDRIVVTAFRGTNATPPSTWAMLSNRPSVSMMGDPKLTAAWDATAFSTTGYQAAVPMTVATEVGERIVYLLNDSWQTFEWEPQADTEAVVNAARLAQPLGPSDEAIVAVAPGADPERFFTVPDLDTQTPGALWVNGERIEYFGLERVDSTFTFSELRRATRGSRLSAERRLKVLSTDGSTTIALPGAQALNVPEVRVQHADGTATCLSLKSGFTVAYDASGLTVTLLVTLAPSDSVLVAQTLPGNAHPAGSFVRDVTTVVNDARMPFHIALDISEDVDVRGGITEI